MSYRVRIEIDCDDRRCLERIAFERDDRGGLNITQAKLYAASNGWNTKGKKQFCPEHSK